MPSDRSPRHPPGAPVEPSPTLIPRLEAFRRLGIGATKGHELINSGAIVARKLHRKTMIELDSLNRFIAGLPRAGRRG